MTAYEKAVAQAQSALSAAKLYERYADIHEQNSAREREESAVWRTLAQQQLDVARAFEAVAANLAQEEAHERETQAH